MFSRVVRLLPITATPTNRISSILKITYCSQKQLIHTIMSEDTPIENVIREKITKGLVPIHLDVINESPNHNVPKGAESHFKLIIVSSRFEKQLPIKRHRMVHDILKEELDEHIHALTLVTKTPEQWEASDKSTPKSPPCQGGSGL